MRSVRLDYSGYTIGMNAMSWSDVLDAPADPATTFTSRHRPAADADILCAAVSCLPANVFVPSWMLDQSISVIMRASGSDAEHAAGMLTATAAEHDLEITDVAVAILTIAAGSVSPIHSPRSARSEPRPRPR